MAGQGVYQFVYRAAHIKEAGRPIRGGFEWMTIHE